MNVIFYDTKNKSEVASNQLMRINYVTDVFSKDRDDSDAPVEFHTMQLGNIGWKSKTCHNSANWDMWTLESNLVFLRLEDNNTVVKRKLGKRVLRSVKKKEEWEITRDNCS
jgi:hypothetical protein